MIFRHRQEGLGECLCKRPKKKAALESKRSIWVEQSCFRYSVSLFGEAGWIHMGGGGAAALADS